MKRDVRIAIPEKGQAVIDIITGAGYEAYMVGGCVRDSLLGTIDTGLQHGTVTVMMGGEGFEVTTYRIDGEYKDSRHPSEVTFSSELGEDLRRRDLTINAMAYNQEEGLVDKFGGLEDLEAGIIRCVGNPAERFQEDALRILRAVRFAAQLSFTIEERTLEAAGELAHTLSRISVERIQTELVKLMVSCHPEYLRIAYTKGITKVFFPEFDRAMETKQRHIHHCYSVGEHILHSLCHVKEDKVLRLAMLLHDIGKPKVLTVDEEGITHFYNHAAVSAEMAEQILRRLKLDNDTIQRVCKLVLYHDFGSAVEPDMRIMRRALHKIGEDAFPDLFAVKRADILAQSDYQRQEKLERVDRWQQLYEEILEKQQCVSLKTLAVKGSDLIDIGWKPGKKLGEVLQKLLELVLEDPAWNTRARLLEEAGRLLSLER